MGLLAIDGQGNGYIENVTVTIWRLACSSSGMAMRYNPSGAANAITLLRIARDPSNEGRTDIVPMFPYVMASQNGSALGTTASLVRMAIEPNTVVSDTVLNTPISNSTTYVLENYPYSDAGYFTFSDGFTLRIDPYITNVAPTDINVPAYVPTSGTYPDAYNPLPIDGYMATNWFDPAHSGEGMQVGVYDNGDGATLTLSAAWYTFDSLGLPFWVYAQGALPIGATSVDTTGSYFTGGGFSGNFGSEADENPWGTLNFSFPDCNTMVFSYNGQADAVSGPTGSGTRTWKRAAGINGMSCE
jgi:hypothetical protein